MVGIAASRQTLPVLDMVSGVTENSFCKNGTNITSPSRQTPAAKAPRLYQLLEKPSLKILCLLLQLKPWNSLARVRVANAMVLAIPASPLPRPRWKAIMVQTAMMPPWVRMVSMKSFVRIPVFGFLGFSDSKSFSAGSMPMAMAGRESVSRLMNNR